MIEHPFQDAEDAKEEDRLHRVKAHKAAIPLEQEEDQTRYPSEEVA